MPQKSCKILLNLVIICLNGENHRLSAIEIIFLNGIKYFIVTYLFQIVINIVYFMFEQLFWHPRFRVHLKHFFFKSQHQPLSEI